MQGKFVYQCIECKALYPGEELHYLCPACAPDNKQGKPSHGVLKTLYDYEAIHRAGSRNADLFHDLYANRYLPLLPVSDTRNLPALRIGDTPLYRVDQSFRFENHTPDFQLFVKDDSQNPTFSFKDRASALVSAWAKEHEIGLVVTASTGNAGSSLAGICASQGQKAVVVVPSTAPIAKLTQILMYGAELIPVLGTYDDAFDLSVHISRELGWYNRNTAYNPLTIEGKKTVSFEIFRDLGLQAPHRIFVPVGDGVILAGVYKGFEDLLMLGLLDRMPVIVAVQAEGSANLVNNLGPANFVSVPSHTIADSISVDIPRNFYMARHYLETYNGEWTTVSDQEIIDASMMLSRSTGMFSEPAAVAAFAGMVKYRKQDLIPTGSVNVVLLTGSGLKDPGAVRSLLKMPDPVVPDIEILGDFLSKIS